MENKEIVKSTISVFPFLQTKIKPENGNRAVSDTGPIIHLYEISLIKVLNIFSQVIIPEEVNRELRNSKIPVLKKIKILKLLPDFKDKVKVLTNQENLDLGEAFAIVLTMQEKADYFLTDDLDARSVAIKYNLQVHGTIGIVLRAFRDGMIDKKTAIEKVNELYAKSSLFITKDLVYNVIRAIEDFKR